MTNIKIFKHNNDIVCVECSGHSGYAQVGEDIICSAISSITQTAVLGILQVANLNLRVERNDEDAYLKFTLPQKVDFDSWHDAQVILQTMLCGLSDIYEGYSNFINLEVISNVN